MKNMEIKTYGRKINMETLSEASEHTRGLGSRTGEYMEIFTTSPPARYGESITGTARNGRSTTMMMLSRSASPIASRLNSVSLT